MNSMAITELCLMCKGDKPDRCDDGKWFHTECVRKAGMNVAKTVHVKQCSCGVMYFTTKTTDTLCMKCKEYKLKTDMDKTESPSDVLIVKRVIFEKLMEIALGTEHYLRTQNLDALMAVAHNLREWKTM